MFVIILCLKHSIYSNVFFYTPQNQGKLGHIAAKTSVPRVSSSGAPRMCHSSYLGVKFNKELIFDAFKMILERLGAQHFKKLTIVPSKR